MNHDVAEHAERAAGHGFKDPHGKRTQRTAHDGPNQRRKARPSQAVVERLVPCGRALLEIELPQNVRDAFARSTGECADERADHSRRCDHAQPDALLHFASQLIQEPWGKYLAQCLRHSGNFRSHRCPPLGLRKPENRTAVALLRAGFSRTYATVSGIGPLKISPMRHHYACVFRRRPDEKSARNAGPEQSGTAPNASASRCSSRCSSASGPCSRPCRCS